MITRAMKRQKAFHECPFCGMSIHFKSWREHLREHGDADAQHIAGGQETGFDPLPRRIENLRNTIRRLEAKAPLSQSKLDLLIEYRSGLIDLELRLEKEQRNADGT
jgi:hypothetical protein